MPKNSNSDSRQLEMNAKPLQTHHWVLPLVVDIIISGLAIFFLSARKHRNDMSNCKNSLNETNGSVSSLKIPSLPEIVFFN